MSGKWRRHAMPSSLPSRYSPEPLWRALALRALALGRWAGGGVVLPGLGHPSPDILLERAVDSHAMSLVACRPAP
jgi:hypothetical protein